jgi:hypothetical protein
MTRFFKAVACIALAVSAQTARGDDPFIVSSEERTNADIRLSDEPAITSNSATGKRSMSAVNHLRQQRAAYQYNQRIARIEANAWLGHDPLRPSWSAVPMMSSHYAGRRTIVVPVYVP